MVSKRAVLWDMDGVLVDSGELHYRSWHETLSEFSIPFDRQKFRQSFGMNNARILTILLGKPPGEDLVKTISDRKESRFRELIPGNLQLLPGVLKWLSRLQENGMLQAVASSAPQANIEAIIDELDIRQYLTATISADEMPGKPAPTVFLESARQLEVQPGQCVVVEDAVAGVTAARRAGMRCIAVTTTHPKMELMAADKVVDSLEELSLEDFFPE
jgi:beta-phosphoglucomutase family hydrolase